MAICKLEHWNLPRTLGLPTSRAGARARGRSDQGLARLGRRRRLVRLWNLVDHTALAADKVHPRGVRALAFSPEGRLTSAGDDGVVLVRAGARRLFALHPIGGEPAGFAVTDDGHAQLYGDAARRFLTCAIGPIHHPLALCEEEVVVPDLVRRVLAGDLSFD